MEKITNTGATGPQNEPPSKRKRYRHREHIASPMYSISTQAKRLRDSWGWNCWARGGGEQEKEIPGVQEQGGQPSRSLSALFLAFSYARCVNFRSEGPLMRPSLAC
eukprot:1151607-Pelagomonas_calceolata.AAC.7